MQPASAPSDTNGSSDKPSKQQSRFTTILTKLQQTGSVAVDSLSEELTVSPVTIRRDLDQLAAVGLLQRTHGGAVSIEPLFYEPFKNDRSFQAQLERFAYEKRRIGRAAAALIQTGETIALSPGTTTMEVIRGLPRNQNITVITNTVNIAMELSKRKDVNVFVTGGHLHGDWFSLVGPTATESLEKMMAHTMFIGVDGIDSGMGMSSLSAEEANVIAAMIKTSRRRIAVADHSKIGKVAGWRIGHIKDLHILITDTGATEEMLDPFRRLAIEVMRV
ncbi:MAG: DeoR/GlpR family DNA-binding transcription regulator [Acidobacteriaceae bacterium]